jgi:hypothetical protein
MDTSGYDGEAADTTRRGQRRLEPLTSVEGERGVNLGGDTAGDDLEDLGTELDEQTVHGVLGLLLEVVALRLAERDGGVNELLVSGELGSGEAEGVSAGATGKAAGCARCASSFWNRGCVGQDRGRRVWKDGWGILRLRVVQSSKRLWGQRREETDMHVHERGVGRGILRLVGGDGLEVTRVGDDDGAGATCRGDGWSTGGTCERDIVARDESAGTASGQIQPSRWERVNEGV